METPKTIAIIVDVIVAIILVVGTFGGTDWDYLLSDEGTPLLIFVLALYLLFIGGAGVLTIWAFFLHKPGAPTPVPTAAPTTPPPKSTALIVFTLIGLLCMFIAVISSVISTTYEIGSAEAVEWSVRGAIFGVLAAIILIPTAIIRYKRGRAAQQ
jgi:hypothetical protein